MGLLSLKNKRVLVTGGNGYLGSFLVEALIKAGALVYIMDTSKKGYHNEFIVDITDKKKVGELVKRINPQIVFHLAAILNRDRDFTHHDRIMVVNYTGTMNLLWALKDIEYLNFLFISSSEVYGGNKAPFHEKMEHKPTSPYSMSKAFSEKAIQLFSELYKKPYTIIRLFNFFGENMPENFFIPQMLKALKHGKVFKMTKGNQARDFLYIDDVVSALLMSARNPAARNEIFNVCSGKSVTMRELAIQFKKELNSTCRIDFGALPYRENEIWNMTGDNRHIREKLGFSVNFEIKEAIRKLNKSK